MSCYPKEFTRGDKGKGKGRRRYKKHMSMREFFHEFGGGPGVSAGYTDEFDPDEAHYWANVRRMMGQNHHTLIEHRRKPDILGFNQKQLAEFLKDLHPDLRHKNEEILSCLEKKKILEPVDYYCDLVLPEEAVDIFTTEIPEVVDDALSIEQVSKWLMDDVKKVISELSEKHAGDIDRKETIDWARFVTDTYRKGLISLRRKVKAELKERELQKEVEQYRDLGWSVPIDELFEDDQAIVNALEQADIRYLFQLIFKSKTEVKELDGIGQIRLDKIEERLLARDLTFTGKEPEKKKKKKKKSDPLEAQIIKV